MEQKTAINAIIKGFDSQFVFNKEKKKIECKCGHSAVWIRDNFVCGTITAYPCQYNKSKRTISSDLIDKQTAVNFAQHLLKDHSTQEVTLSDLNDFLNIK